MATSAKSNDKGPTPPADRSSQPAPTDDDAMPVAAATIASGATAAAAEVSGDDPLDSDVILPFVGRSDEILHIENFVRSALSADRLSALWLQGQAGVGKSRLVDRLVEKFGQSVILLRARLYPNTPPSLSESLLAGLVDAADRYALDLDLPSKSATMPTLLGIVRGLVHRYPTILVLEDLHLLNEATSRDLSTLLHGLEQEAIGVLVTARPTTAIAYGLLLPFLVATLELKPFDRDALDVLARHFGHDPAQLGNLLDYILAQTHGMPLALWSILQRITRDREEFRRSPLRQVRRIADEISDSLLADVTQSLSDDDITAAGRLALLGEVFAASSAAVIIDDAAALLERLRRASLILPALPTRPIIGTTEQESPEVYRFSHSVVHDRLRREAPEGDSRFVPLVLDGHPLYSTLPIETIMQLPLTPDCPEEVITFLNYLFGVINNLAWSPRWSVAVELLEGSHSLLERCRRLLSTTAYNKIFINSLLLQCEVYHGHSTRPQFQDAIAELVAMTARPSTPDEARQRLRTLAYNVLAEDPSTFASRIPGLFDESHHLILRFPTLLLDKEHQNLLKQIGGGLRLLPSSADVVPRFRQLLDRMIEQATGQDDVDEVNNLLHSLAPFLITTFTTPEELVDRTFLADQVMASFGSSRPDDTMLITWPRFLEMTGRADEATEFLDRYCEPTLAGFNISIEVSLRLQRLLVMTARAAPFDEVIAECQRLIAEFEEIRPPEPSAGNPGYLRRAVASHLMVCGVMSGRITEAIATAVRLCHNHKATLQQLLLFERTTLLGDDEELIAIAARGTEHRLFPRALDWLRQPNPETAAIACAEIETILRLPVLQRRDLAHTRVCIALLEMIAGDGPFDPARVEVIRDGLRSCLLWLAERKAPGFLPPFRRIAAIYLEEEEIATLLGSSTENEKRPATAEMEKVEEPGLWSDRLWEEATLKVFVLGDTLLQRPNEPEPKRIRGARQRRFVALLAAQELLAAPIDVARFRRWATEIEDHDEGANYLRILVSRLRKSIGTEMIITDPEHPPRFHPESIATDAVRVARLFDRATELAAAENGGGAIAYLEKGMEILSAGRPFAEFDAPLFEAARQELTDLLRSTTGKVVTLLRRKGADERAATLIDKSREIL